ncbi:MAG: FtsX-like permease family protein [Candidatus Bathyarchaeia archaeon]
MKIRAVTPMDKVDNYGAQASLNTSIKVALFWALRKRIRLSRCRIWLAIVATALTSAAFTLLCSLTVAAGEWLAVVPATVITLIALLAILLYPTLHSNYEISIFKALGADRSAITALFFLEMLLVGIVGVSVGVLAGGGLIFLAPMLGIYRFPTLGSAGYGLITVLCLLGVLAGSLVGIYINWRKISQVTVEILSHAK